MSSFAINGRLVYDTAHGPTALASAIPSDGAESETRRRGVSVDDDPRVHLLELVAALAREIRGRGDQVTRVDVE